MAVVSALSRLVATRIPLGIGLLVVGLSTQLGCSAEAPTSPRDPDSSPSATSTENDGLVYERNVYFEGLEEWVLIHKGPDGQYCQRSDGRRQDCEAVKAEDRAVAYQKWGAMDKPFGIKVLAANPEDVFEAYVTMDVPSGPLDTQAQRDAFFANVLVTADKWQAWVEAQGGTVLVPSVETMPEFSMRGTAKLFRTMAWMPGLVAIMEKTQSAAAGGYLGTGAADSAAFAGRGESLQPPFPTATR